MDEEKLWYRPGFQACVNLVLIITMIIVWSMVAYLYFTSRDRTTTPSMVLPTPIAQMEAPYEHCIVSENTGLAYQANAGTPIPTTVVAINTPIPTETLFDQPTAAPTMVPTEIPETVKPTPIPTEIPFDPDLGEIIQVGTFDPNNYHVVIVGVGYQPNINQYTMIETIMGLNRNFSQVRIDFAYAKNSIMAKLQGVEQNAQLSKGDSETLIKKIRSMAPADIVVLLVNTNQGLGVTLRRNDGMNYIVITGEVTDTVFDASHEIAHGLGLSDGYNEYIPNQIPGSELFYLDSMPTFLVKALEKMGTVPPIYEDGTCEGKKLYRFYPKQGNIMATYQPEGPYPWGDNIFTPLQVVIMNDFVQNLRK